VSFFCRGIEETSDYLGIGSQTIQREILSTEKENELRRGEGVYVHN
jgi:hypothetical protein